MLSFWNIVEIINSSKISERLIIAIIEPIIVNQFLNDGGSFMLGKLRVLVRVKIEKYWMNLQAN